MRNFIFVTLVGLNLIGLVSPPPKLGKLSDFIDGPKGIVFGEISFVPFSRTEGNAFRARRWGSDREFVVMADDFESDGSFLRMGERVLLERNGSAIIAKPDEYRAPLRDSMFPGW